MAGGVPNELLKLFHTRRPEALSLLVKSAVGFWITIFLAQLAEELGEPFFHGVNYINIRDSVRQLRHRFPSYREHFESDSPYQSWLVLPTRRCAPRERLSALLELIEAGLGDDAFLPYGHSSPPPEPVEPGASSHGAERAPIIPDFEGIYYYVDRGNHVPAMVLIDSLDSLAGHYGVPAVRLADTLQRDLVDTGFANVVATVDGDSDPPLETVFDGVVALRNLHDPGSFPWSLLLEKLPGADLRQTRYVLSPQAGRLVALPSDRDEVGRLLGERTPDISGGLPREFLGFFGGSAALHSDESTFFGGRR